jgi:Leucine-rich repeat (LRR) protein
LPSEFAKLSKLRVLDLGYNWFSVAPAVVLSLPALEELDLNNNNLQELPSSLGTLKSLKKLYLRSNPLTHGDATAGPYAPIIRQLEANKTEVFY